MQPDRNDRRLTGTVRGVGLSDALILELEAVQVPWLVDELDEMRPPLEEEWQRATDAFAASTDERDREELEEREYELTLLRMMHDGLPASHHDTPVTFAGPSGLVSDAVRGAMQNAV